MVICGVLMLGSCACCGGGYLILPGENWRRYESPTGGFAVDVPGPVKPDMPIPGMKPDPNVKVEGTILWKRGEFYVVTYGDLPPAGLRGRSDEAILDEVVREMQSDREIKKIVRNERITVSGFPAREIEYIYEDGGTWVGRLVVADRRMYVVLGGGRFVGPGNANVRRFLDSFEITNPVLRAEGQRREEKERKETAQREANERAKQENEAFRTGPYNGPRPGNPRALAAIDEVVHLSFEEPAQDGVGRWGTNERLLFKGVHGTGVRGNAAYLSTATAAGEVRVELGALSNPKPPLGTTGYTLSGWYRARSRGCALFHLKPLESDWAPRTNRGVAVRIDAQLVRVSMVDDAGKFELTTARPSDDAWHHVAMVCTPSGTGATTDLYLDGVRVASDSGRLIEPSGMTRFANSTPQGIELFGVRLGFGELAQNEDGWPQRRDADGVPQRYGPNDWLAAVDECCLFTRPLGPNDVRKLAGREPMPDRVLKRYGPEPRTPFPVPDPQAIPGLKMYFPFDEIEGRTARDAVGGTSPLLAHDPELVTGARGPAVRVTGRTGRSVSSWGLWFGDNGKPLAPGTDAPFTLAVWVRTDEAGSILPQALISGRGKNDKTGALDFLTVRRDPKGSLELSAREYGAQEPKAQATRPGTQSGEWVHLAVACDARGALRWAVNGEVQAVKGAYTGGFKINSLILGSAYEVNQSGNSKALPFTAEFDEFCVFNRALKDDELAALAGRKALPKK